MQDSTADDDPTGESLVLDASVVAGATARPVADDSVVDPNVLALRRVDAEIRRLMESWVELESQLHGRDSEILRLQGWASGLDEDLRATRQELGAARSECERLRAEAIEQRAEVDSQRRRAGARTAEAEGLRMELAASQGRVGELTAEVRLGRERTEELTGRLAEHRDALAGMAARLRQAEKSSHGVDSEKAELAARIADAEQRCAELAGRYRDAEAAGTARMAELQGQLDIERTRVAALEAERAQLLAGMQELRDQAMAVDTEFQAKRKAIAVLGDEINRLSLIQANVRKLDNMMNDQLSNQGPPPAAGKPCNERLVVRLDGTRAVKYPLYKPEMVIGRARDSDIRVTGSRTSRRHAHILVEDGEVLIEDLGSLNGITVNGESVCRKRLHDGDLLDVGGARLRYVDLDERAATASREAMVAN